MRPRFRQPLGIGLLILGHSDAQGRQPQCSTLPTGTAASTDEQISLGHPFGKILDEGLHRESAHNADRAVVDKAPTPDRHIPDRPR